MKGPKRVAKKIMGHGIGKFDEHHGREQAWHGLTKVNPELSLSNEDFYLRRWDYVKGTCKVTRPDGSTVTSAAVITKDESTGVEIQRDLEVPMVEGDTIPKGETLFCGPPYNPETYTLLNNQRMLELIESSLNAAGIPLDVSSVGSVFNRRRVFVSIPLPSREKTETGGREFRAFLNFINSVDGTTEFFANVSNICTVCNNTLQGNLAEGGFLIPHTKYMESRLTRLPSVIEQAVALDEAFSNLFMKLASEGVSLDEMRGIFAHFVTPEKQELSTRGYGTVERLCQLFKGGAGNRGETLADGFSAITDYYSHESATSDSSPAGRWKQYQSSEFGLGAQTKCEAVLVFERLLTREFRNELAEQGNQLLANFINRSELVKGKRVVRRGSVIATLPPAPAPETVPAPAPASGKKGKGKGKK